MKWIIYELRIWNQVKLWSSHAQLWTQFLQLRREAWKIQDFNGVWTRDLALPVRRSNQLSYEATDAGSWSFVGSNGPVRNESMMKWYMKWIIYELLIWNQVKLWSSQLWTQFLQLRREAWKIQDFNGVWTRDLALPVRRSNQLSYEATDVGSWSFVGYNGPVRNESMMKWCIKWIIYELRIWNQVKLWSSQLWTEEKVCKEESFVLWVSSIFVTALHRTMIATWHISNIIWIAEFRQVGWD